MPAESARPQKLVTIMPARDASPPDHQKDQVFAAVFRNLVLYGFLFHLFASQAADFFSGVNDSDPVSDAGSLYNQLVLSAAFLTV
jgi:hypothetical protein